MARLLFVTWDGGGNLPPALGIAADVQRRGHLVRFLGHAQQRASIEHSGFAFQPYAHARPWSSTAPAHGLTAADDIFSMFTDVGPGVDLLDAVGADPTDAVVVDCMSLGALQAAEQAGLRRVVLVHTYWAYLTQQWARGPIVPYARAHGQRPERLWGSAEAVLVAADPSLDPAGGEDLPASIRHVGVVQPTPQRRASHTGNGRPRVLVSLSTTFFPGQDEALQSILDALAELPVDGVVTTGDAVDPQRLRRPQNVEVHRFMPHEQILPTVDLVIGHGGHSTTMRALSHDLPLVVLPMHPMLDQAMNGRSVEEQGAAVVLTKTSSPNAIRAAVRALLAPGPHRDAAARIGAQLRSRNGAAAAADVLDHMLGRPSA
jgi:UDP:flavonoid glycosyltransferase YjiC (YdhE family)